MAKSDEQLCSIRIMFMAESDEQALEVKKKIEAVLIEVKDARSEFTLTPTTLRGASGRGLPV